MDLIIFKIEFKLNYNWAEIKLMNEFLNQSVFL